MGEGTRAEVREPILDRTPLAYNLAWRATSARPPSLWDTGGGGPRVVLGLGLSVDRFLRFVRSARFLRGARRGPARPYLLAFSAHHPRPSSPPSRTHVLSCARRARSPPRWRQERLFNTLRWRCAAPAVTASCAASRLAERERRSTRHGTAPNIPRRARVLPALSPQSLLLTLSPRVSCAARPHVRRPSAARERSALWWRREMICHETFARRAADVVHLGGTSDRAYVCLAPFSSLGGASLGDTLLGGEPKA